jgi:hypothetical protein
VGIQGDDRRRIVSIPKPARMTGLVPDGIVLKRLLEARHRTRTVPNQKYQQVTRNRIEAGKRLADQYGRITHR